MKKSERIQELPRGKSKSVRSKQQKKTLTISPKASPLQLISSGLIPANERSEWVGETGGEELVLPNMLCGAAVFAPPLSTVAVNRAATATLLSVDWLGEEAPPTAGTDSKVCSVVGTLPPICS